MGNDELPIKQLTSIAFECKGLSRGAPRYLLRREEVVPKYRQSNRGNEMCDNEMSRDHDAPLEYLRILASLKLRFGLATLVTAHGALPVVYPIEEQGHSATQ